MQVELYIIKKLQKLPGETKNHLCELALAIGTCDYPQCSHLVEKSTNGWCSNWVRDKFTKFLISNLGEKKNVARS